MFKLKKWIKNNTNINELDKIKKKEFIDYIKKYYKENNKLDKKDKSLKKAIRDTEKDRKYYKITNNSLKNKGLIRLDNKTWKDFGKYINNLNFDLLNDEDKKIKIVYLLFSSNGSFLIFFNSLFKVINIGDKELNAIFDKLPIDLGKSAISALKIYHNRRNEAVINNSFLVHDNILKLRKIDLKEILSEYLKNNFDRIFVLKK